MHGLEPVIISSKKKSDIYGAQYLHQPIPGITDKDSARQIKTTRLGVEGRYAERVYGDAQTVTSWQKVRTHALCWDLRASYDAAWNKFASNIVDWVITPFDLEDFQKSFDLVITTIPQWALCTGAHHFQSTSILVKKDLGGIDVPPDSGENFIIYNGTEKGIWYRASSIFGFNSVEATPTPELAEQGWEAGYKIIGNHCDCNPNVVRAGRMGKWERGVLTHNAFDTAVEAISERLGLVLGGRAGSS